MIITNIKPGESGEILTSDENGVPKFKKINGIQIFNNNQDKRKDGCPECSGILKEEGCVYELCKPHYYEFLKNEKQKSKTKKMENK